MEQPEGVLRNGTGNRTRVKNQLMLASEITGCKACFAAKNVCYKYFCATLTGSLLLLLPVAKQIYMKPLKSSQVTHSILPFYY